MNTVKDTMAGQAEYIKALDSIEKLHPAPQVLAKANVKMQDPNVEVYDIVELLKADASLTTDIIRLSNSAYYGFEIECTNLSSAISRVGFREVIRLIGLAIAAKLLNQDLKSYDIPAEAYWADCVTSALLMEGFALYGGEKPQDAYIVGLLHSVGMVVINQIIENFELDCIWDKSTPPQDWEREQIGFNQSFAGATILKRWHFPNDICHPILHQFKEPEEGGDYLQFSLYYVNKLREQVGFGISNMDWDTGEFDPLLEYLQMSKDDMNDMLAAAKESFDTISTSIGFK